MSDHTHTITTAPRAIGVVARRRHAGPGQTWGTLVVGLTALAAAPGGDAVPREWSVG